MFPDATSARSRTGWAAFGRFLIIDVLVWTALGLFLGIQSYYNYSRSVSVPLRQLFLLPLVRYWIYAALTPGVFWLARKCQLAREHRGRVLAIILAGLLAFEVGCVALRMVVYPPVIAATLEFAPRSFTSALNLLRSSLYEQLWMYASILGVALLLDYYREARRRELREAELKSQVVEYELQILKLQLHPHFLFNTLNGISALMGEDIEKAREMIVRLSELLRVALAHSSRRQVLLREELDFIEAYLDIERMRFGERLRVRMDIAPETFTAEVPNMVLQPLVENAVRHGIAPHREGGEVTIVSRHGGEKLRLTVGNDGSLSPSRSRQGRHGLGLANTRARLLQLYGDAYHLQIGERSGGGVEVCLEIPFNDSVKGDTREADQVPDRR